MEITNLSQLKQKANRYTWELYLYSNEGIPTNNMHHKFMNIIRKVEKLQTNALMFEGGSWLYFAKANNYKFEPYLYNDKDIIVTIKEDNFPYMGYHLRPINNN